MFMTLNLGSFVTSYEMLLMVTIVSLLPLFPPYLAFRPCHSCLLKHPIFHMLRLIDLEGVSPIKSSLDVLLAPANQTLSFRELLRVSTHAAQQAGDR